jgi:cytosine/creatinine deaminase
VVGVLIKRDTAISDEVLNAIAHVPTAGLPSVIERGFFEKLNDRDFMRIAVWLAQKSYDEGDAPSGR